MYSIIFHPVAEHEFLDSVEYYENKLFGLGEEFIKEVEKLLRLIEKKPAAFPCKYDDFREAVIKRFPYLVIYRINENKKTIKILYVFHTSRNPAKKYKRI